MATEDDFKRRPPESALDFNMAVLNSTWGKDHEINEDLKDKLSKNMFVKDDDTGRYVKDEENKFLVNKKYLWGLLAFYTRDMRLANINDQQLIYCSHFIDLAADFLHTEMLEPFNKSSNVEPLICFSNDLKLSSARSSSKAGFNLLNKVLRRALIIKVSA